MQGREALVGVLAARRHIEAEQIELWMVLDQCGQFGPAPLAPTITVLSMFEYSKSGFEIRSLLLRCKGSAIAPLMQRVRRAIQADMRRRLQIR